MNNITIPTSLPGNLTLPTLGSILPPGALSYILFALLGALLATFGLYFVRLVASIVFAGVLGYLAWRHGHEVLGDTTMAFILLVFAVLVGLYIGWILFRLTISILLAYVAVRFITSDPYQGLAILSGLTPVIYIFTRLIRLALPVILTGSGLYLFYSGLTSLQIDMLLTIATTGILGSIGFYNQYRRRFYI
jgi:hypothetical protein